MTGIPFAYSFFSTLAPGSTIAPHYGASNLKLRCHLPLYCECGLHITFRVSTSPDCRDLMCSRTTEQYGMRTPSGWRCTAVEAWPAHDVR